MSDTPRTNAAYFKPGATMYDLAGEMKRVERELNAANERIKQLEAVVNDPEALWSNWLRGTVKLPSGIGDVRRYQAHIQRLEEAGDGLVGTAKAMGAWRKAKDAKKCLRSCRLSKSGKTWICTICKRQERIKP